jgi:hypothetical protein
VLLFWPIAKLSSIPLRSCVQEEYPASVLFFGSSRPRCSRDRNDCLRRASAYAHQLSGSKRQFVRRYVAPSFFSLIPGEMSVTASASLRPTEPWRIVAEEFGSITLKSINSMSGSL